MNKKPRLAVVTHTNRARPEYMELMLASLKPALPDYAEHFIIDCPTMDQYWDMRWEARNLGEHVCFIDDDDLIVNDGIRRCMAEFDKNPDLGCAFTCQEMIDENGEHLPDLPTISRDTVFSYHSLAVTAQAVHHLAIFRSAAVEPNCDKIAKALGNTGVEWLMKVTSAFRHRAVHVPIYGYQWRQHSASASKDKAWIDSYNQQLARLQSFLLSYVYPEGDVPRAVV